MGHYCSHCETFYDLNNKLYKLREKLYAVYNVEEKSEYESISKSHKNISKLYDNYNIYTEKAKYMGRVGFEPTTPAMSRRYLNQARPPALVLQLLIFFSLLFIYNCSLFSSSVDLKGLFWFLFPFRTWTEDLIIFFMFVLPILVRSDNSLSMLWFLLNLVRSDLGNNWDNSGISFSIKVEIFLLMIDFSLYSYDLDTCFWPWRKWLSALERSDLSYVKVKH